MLLTSAASWSRSMCKFQQFPFEITNAMGSPLISWGLPQKRSAIAHPWLVRGGTHSRQVFERAQGIVGHSLSCLVDVISHSRPGCAQAQRSQRALEYGHEGTPHHTMLFGRNCLSRRQLLLVWVTKRTSLAQPASILVQPICIASAPCVFSCTCP